MSIIYNSVSSEIRRKCENKENIDQFVADLLKLYKPKDKNKDGDNLLTIFLNELIRDKPYLQINSHLVNNLLEQKFKIQSNRIRSKALDYIVEFLDHNNNLKKLPKYLEITTDAFYLILPTIHTKKLMDNFYKKNVLMYDEAQKFNILDYIFDKDLSFSSKEDVMKYVGEMEEILTTLFINKNLHEDHLKTFDNDKFISDFTYCIEKKLEHMNRVNSINSLFNHKPIPSINFDSQQYLKKLKATIFSEVLKIDLEVKDENVGKNKKPNKI